MKPGQVVESFAIKGKNGETLDVIFRFPRMSDARTAMRFINKARDETEFLGMRKHETVSSEKKFMAEQLKNIKQGKGVFLFVEIDGKMVGDAIILPEQHDTAPHVGKLGIALREQFTGLGIGTRLMQKMLQLARRGTKLKIIESGYFAPNKPSEKLHKKFGFKQYGRFPKACLLRNGAYCDHIYLYKTIKKL